MRSTRKILDYTKGEGRKITADSLSKVAICRMEMAEEGFLDQEMATAFALEALSCLERAIPDKKYREMWLRAAFRMER